MGGDAAKAGPGTRSDHQLIGRDWYEAGTMVASHFFDHPARLTFASGQDFPMASAAERTRRCSSRRSSVCLRRAFLGRHGIPQGERRGGVTDSALVGGPGVVTENVRTSLGVTLGGL